MSDRKAKERLAKLLQEKQKRDAKDDFLTFVQWMFPAYRVNWHHQKIGDALMQIESGEIDRLLIDAPPRHGKSTLASVFFPAWYLGRNPRHEIIATAYGEALIAGFGARLRNFMGQPHFAEVFGQEAALASDMRARDRWLTNSGGVYRAAGVGGAITGFGAHLFLVDDPVRGREDADSPTIREKIWEWWQNDAYTRLMKNGRIIVIGTRWHEDDPIGRMLQQQGTVEEGGEWNHIHLPAINDDGEALWPDEFDLDWLERTRKAVGPRAWQSLYQGNPTPEEGTFFRNEWFHPSVGEWTPEDAKRGIIRTYGASDYAVTAAGRDFTVHVVVAVDAMDMIHIVDMWIGKATPDVWTDAMLDLMVRWKPLMWAEGKGGLQRAADPFITKRQKERKVWSARMQISETENKEARAQSFQGRMATGCVFWNEKAPWYSEAKNQLLKFPTGTNDDIVDALSLVGMMLDGMTAGGIPHTPKDTREPAITTTIGAAALPEGYRQATWGDIVRSSMAKRRRMRL